MKDEIIRALLCEGNIACIAACTGQAVARARELLHTGPDVTVSFGKLLTAGAMIAQRVKDDADKLTLIYDGNGPSGKILVTAQRDGTIKGYAQHPQAALPVEMDDRVASVTGEQGKFTLIRANALGQPYIGVSPLLSDSISENLEAYFAASEQQPSVFLLTTESDAAEMIAGGFLFSAMPDCPEQSVMCLREKLKELKSIPAMLHNYDTMEELLQKAFGDIGVRILTKSQVHYQCDCSRSRIEEVLLTLGRCELQSMLEDRAETEICCQFCNKKYTFEKNDLKDLIAKSKC